MNKYNFQTYIDFGASKIRIGVFDYELPKNNLYNQIECISNFDKEKLNIDTSKNLINKLIQSSEKELNLHIKNITLMIDAPDVQSFDFSIKKNLDSKSSFFEDIKFLLQDARQLAQKNNEKKIIIHTIIEKIIIDDKIYNELPNNNINYKSIALELKFIYISEIFYNTIIKHFKLIHIEVDNILCSSYVKSSNYNQYFKEYNKKTFLDIGYKKSCVTIFDKDKLILFRTIPLGGNHITQDISKVLDIEFDEAEQIKQSLNKKEATFSDNSKEELFSNKILSASIKNNISLDLLKKVIHARIDEIFNLSFQNIKFDEILGKNDKCILILTGDGSKILDKNSIYIENFSEYFHEINFFEENSETICMSGINYNKKNNNFEVKIIPKKIKKSGFFEKLFHIFN
jgi:cell division protein FtsA